MHKITKLLLATSIAALPSMAGVFVGVDYNIDTMNTIGDVYSYEGDSYDAETNGYTISLGIGGVDSRVFEIYYSSQTASDGNIFVLPQYNGGYIYSGDNYSEIGVNYRPYWEIAHNLHWYLDMGISQRTTDVSSTSDIRLDTDTVNALAVTVGLGLSYNITNRFELNVGYRASYCDWDTMSYSDDSYNNTYYTEENEEWPSSTNTEIYFGVNIWFGDSGTDTALIKENKEKELQENIDDTF
jgi:opacity protein-like surface antigen